MKHADAVSNDLFEPKKDINSSDTLEITTVKTNRNGTLGVVEVTREALEKLCPESRVSRHIIAGFGINY